MSLGDKFLDFRDDLLDFIDYNRGKIIIISLVLVIVLGIALFFLLTYEPERITISTITEDGTQIVGTKARELKFSASNKSGEAVTADNIEWTVEAGLVTEEPDGTAKWQLPTDEGTYGITATMGEDSSTKYITVLGNELCKQYMTSDYKIIVQDQDGDGLTDFYEATYSQTNSQNKDSDGDGLFDGDEVSLGLNPNATDSKGDGLNDGERKLNYTMKIDNVTIEMEGKGNFTQTSVDKYPTETLDNVSSVFDGLYAFYTQATLDNADVTITYDKKKLEETGVEAKNIAVYELNEDENSFKKITTKIDEEKGTVSFSTNKFGKYFLADTSKLTSTLTTDLVFLIDNSGSMYSKDIYSSSEENDVDFKRVDVVNKLVGKLKGKYRFGAGKFTFQYKDIVTLTDDEIQFQNSVSTIKTIRENFSGTYIGAGLEGALKQFSNEAAINRRYIVLISDGEDTDDVEGYDEKLLEEQIKIAQEKKVKVYTVGLGSVIDEENLKGIADQTNGKYFFASTDEDLEVIFNLISADLNYNLYDTDFDGADDSVILADSGFLVGRDGFSFSNFSNTQVEYGYGYGMTLFAKLLYDKNLPEKLGATKENTPNGQIVTPEVEPKSVISEEMTTLRTYKSEALASIVDSPVDFWGGIVDGTLSIKDAYKAQIATLGFTTHKTAYKSKNAKFKSYESLSFDMTPYLQEEDPEESPLSDEDISLFRTLARLDITKYRDEKFYFYDNNDKAFAELKEELAKGSPVMIRINADYTVLATKLLGDAKNMNKYKIEVYDPNYAGFPKYIEVERTKYSNLPEISKVITDKYEYKFKYQGVDVGICISVPNVVENG